MESPFIRAKAKDMVDALDNVTAYFEPNRRQEIVEFVRSTFAGIEQVLAHADEDGADLSAAYKTFVEKFDEYWNNPPD